MKTQESQDPGTRLSQERRKLPRLIQTAAEAEQEVLQAGIKLTDARAALARDQEDAVLIEGHQPSQTLAKAAATAEKEHAAAVGRAAVYRRAAARQRGVIESILGDIKAQQHDAFAIQLEPLAAEVRALVDRLAGLVAESSAIARQHNQDAHALSEALFPMPGNITDSVRDAKIAVCNAALLLPRQRAILGRAA